VVLNTYYIHNTTLIKPSYKNQWISFYLVMFEFFMYPTVLHNVNVAEKEFPEIHVLLCTMSCNASFKCSVK
jgi:hypothetical protein